MIPPILSKKWYFRNTGNGYYEIRTVENVLICEVDIHRHTSPVRGLMPEGTVRVVNAIGALPDLLQAIENLINVQSAENIAAAKEALKKATFQA